MDYQDLVKVNFPCLIQYIPQKHIGNPLDPQIAEYLFHYNHKLARNSRYANIYHRAVHYCLHVAYILLAPEIATIGEFSLCNLRQAH